MVQSPSDQLAEADRLKQQALQQRATSPQAALLSLQQALAIYQQIGVRKAFPQESRAWEGAILNVIGKCYASLGQYSQALENHQQALAIAKEVGDRLGKAVAFISSGAIYQNLGQYSQALSQYQQALEVTKAIGDRTEEGRILSDIGNVLSRLRQYPQALDYYRRGLAIAQEVDDRKAEGRILDAISEIHDNFEQHPLTLDSYPQALSTRQAEAERLYQQATQQYKTSQFQAALQPFQQALALYQEIGDRRMEGVTRSNIALDYRRLGQYPKALEQFQQALDIAKEIDDRTGEGRTLNNIGLVYQSLGQYLQALEQYQQALIILRAVGDHAGEGVTLNSIGEVCWILGQYPQALKQFQQALTIAREIGDRTSEGKTLNNIGLVYQGLGQYLQALEQYQQALAIAREVSDRVDEGTTLNNIGSVYWSLGQNSQALQQYQQASAMMMAVGDRACEGITLSNLGGVLLESGQFAVATDILFSAIEVQESLRASELSDTSRIALIDTQNDSYNSLQQALVAQNKFETALEVSERSRTRAFVDLLSRRVLPEAVNGSMSAPTIEQIRQTAHEQNATLVQYSIASEPFQVDGKKVWQASKLYIWMIKPTGEITFRSVDLTTTDISLSALIHLSRESIGIRDRGYSIPVKPITQQPQQAKLQLQKLYQILIAPIADLLPTDSFDRIIFIPQGELFLVPFAALQDPDGSYLIQAHTILTAPSIQVLDLTHQLQCDRSIDFSKALIAGNPTMPHLPTLLQPLPALPRAEQEAIAIAQQLQVQPLIGDAATETAVVQRMANASVIHLATHGLLEYGNPQASGVRDLPGAIVLARSEQDDGLLTSSKIFNLKLHASLVVLSACETGRGDITGDGVIGLSRALISAGASSVVVSLWKVADHSTEALMTEFYRQLQRQPYKAQALRQAMLKTMQHYPDPIDWAAFTLIGEAEN